MNKIPPKDVMLLYLGVSGGFIGAGIYGLFDYFKGELVASTTLIAFALIIFFVLWMNLKKKK